MQNMRLEADEVTPFVDLDANSGQITFKGICTPEDPHSFFEPIVAWFTNYFAAPKASTNVSFHLEYFNTSSSMVIMHILKMLAAQTSTELKVKWLVDEGDDDMIEVGEDYGAIVADLDMEIIEIPD